MLSARWSNEFGVMATRDAAKRAYLETTRAEHERELPKLSDRVDAKAENSNGAEVAHMQREFDELWANEESFVTPEVGRRCCTSLRNERKGKSPGPMLRYGDPVTVTVGVAS
jgi:hypothetical protein